MEDNMVFGKKIFKALTSVISAAVIVIITIISGTFAIRSHAESVNAESDTVYYRYTAMYRVCAG